MTFKSKGKYHIAWYGENVPDTGYGSSNIGIRKALEATKVCAYPALLDDGTADAITDTDCEVGVHYTVAGMGNLEKMSQPYRILYTMFETDKWPVDWVNACSAANQVWVPSTFCRDTLIESGCESPVRLVPLGVDPETYYGDPFCADEVESEAWTFGFAGAASVRKGFDLVLRAFREEFPKEEDARLVIRSSSVLPDAMLNDKRITVVDTRLYPNGMRAFYDSIDCFLLPTRGEGFGLTALEAMACGCCTAVTNWGGCTDYLGEHSLRVAIDGLESCQGYHGSDGQWAKPSLASLKFCMRWAYENRSEAREMGRAAADYVCANWSYAQTAKKIEEIVAEIDPKERVETFATDVIVWTGNPRKVRVPGLGEFVRGVPRGLTAEQGARLDPNDTRWSREKRLRRKR